MAPFRPVLVGASGASAVEGPIGEDAVRTLHQTLYRLRVPTDLLSSRLGPKHTSEEVIFPPRCCPYCQQAFQPSKHRPDQGVCSRPACQARRHNEYRRKKCLTDPEYAQVICDSRRKWREAHSDYQKNYRLTHPDSAARNRQQQHQRDQKRRVVLLVKNTLVLDLKHSAAEVWLVGPLAGDLVKNTLVSSKLLIVQAPSPAMAPSAES